MSRNGNHGLFDWLRERPADVAMRDEPFEPVLVRLLSGDEIASCLSDDPARFLDFWRKARSGEKIIFRHHFWRVVQHAIEDLCTDYDTVRGLLEALGQEAVVRQHKPYVSQVAWNVWFTTWFRGPVMSQETAQNDLLAELAVELVPPDVLAGLLAGLDIDGLVRLVNTVKHKRFARRLAEVHPTQIAKGALEAWNRRRASGQKTNRWPICTDISEIVEVFGVGVLIQNELLLGYSLGVLSCQHGVGIDQPEYWRSRSVFILGLSHFTSLPPGVLNQSRLWYLLYRLFDYHKHSYDHRTEILGVSSEMTAFVTEHPDCWAVALPSILERADLLNGLAESVTVLLARDSKCVTDALEACCSSVVPSEVKDRALGIRALCRGMEVPDKTMVRAVMDTITKWVDGAQLFPHPLELPASTWLASMGTEGVLRSLVQTAESEFRDFFRTSAGLDEEIHTGRLLAELERAMRKADLGVRGFAARSGKRPLAVVSHRQAPKRPDEAIFGFDLALIVKGSIPQQFILETAEFIQVKKLRRPGAAQPFGSDWSIDLVQLGKILNSSATSAYWLFDGSGKGSGRASQADLRDSIRPKPKGVVPDAFPSRSSFHGDPTVTILCRPPRWCLGRELRRPGSENRARRGRTHSAEIHI